MANNDFIPNALRQRSHKREKSPKQPNGDNEAKNEEFVWGKTPGGKVFRVPTTYDVLTNLFHPRRPKSHLDLLNLALLGLQVVLFITLSRRSARIFFSCYFIFWRIAYDGGLGWILTKQSKHRWIVREIQRLGWLDGKKRPDVYRWIQQQLQGKMGADYSFNTLPVEYNSWLLFRQLVDIILVNDFLSYTFFAFSCFRLPQGLSIVVHVLRWVCGIGLIAFNIWVKKEAHHIVKDYGWYWGDCFFERGALVFDGVFEMAPHPMYSVGYAGYYGLSLIAGSYPVLFASLFAHIAQFAFLVFFENPHIERMYGERKLMSLRTPVVADAAKSQQGISVSPAASSRSSPLRGRKHARVCSSDYDTPSVTDGDTGTDTELLTENEEDAEFNGEIISRPSTPRQDTVPRVANGRASPVFPEPPRRGPCSQHDILARFFRKDPIGLKNVDLMRAGDVKLVLLVLYIAVAAILPSLSAKQTLALHFLHTVFWRCIHSFGLGLLLREQSKRKYIVRYFMSRYYYPEGYVRQGALEEAFTNWKSLYNMSVCMTYASFCSLTWQAHVMPNNWIDGDQLLRHILGLALITLHIWTAVQSFEVLGVFGWFFGDFFIEDYPATLDYTGIYRYLNNPERTMSGAAFFGMALISGSKLVFALAVFSHLSHWWFLSNVEDPHMRKVYGASLRKEAGLTKAIKRMALKNAKMLNATPKIERIAKGFRGTVGKVYGEATDVLEDLINKSTPKLQDAVQDAKILLQQSTERLVITQLASDLSPYDVSKYSASFATGRSPDGRIRFHLGEPIKVEWHAPKNHSRRDWIGIYRVGANTSKLETRTASQGLWLGVHNEEWHGNTPINDNEELASEPEQGTVVFSGDKIPWQIGEYEIRYHHDGKHNVMVIGGPFEIYVSKPTSFDFVGVRSCLLHIINLCLEADPSLLPQSAFDPNNLVVDNINTDSHPSADDFRFWSEKQAKRIAISIKAVFGVEYSHGVILADANLTTLANRVLATRELSES